METVKRLRVSEVNPHLICVLCGGYYIDATTIIECLHTFCKTCIVGYLEASKHCPVCDNLVHKTKPHLRLRPDHTLQDLVYKLVPGLFQDEMKKRRAFYKEDVESGRVGENGILEERERTIYSADEKISVILELSSDGAPHETNSSKSSPSKRQSGKSKHVIIEAADRRYLSCPGSFTIGHLKKFIRMKFNLCDQYQMDFYHTDETLLDHYSLLDVAYIYSWRRKGPLRLYYTVYTNPTKHFKAEVEQITPMETDEINNFHLKSETSGYFTDEENLAVEPNKPYDFHDSKNDSGLGMDETDYGKDNDVKATSKNDTKNDLASKNVDGDIGEVRSGDKETKKMESKNSVSSINKEMKKHKDENEYFGNRDTKSFDLKINNVNALEDSEESINLMYVSQKEHCDEHSVGSSKEMSEQIDGKLVKLETQATKEFRNNNINDNNITSECSTNLSQNKEKCVSKCQKVSKSCVTDEDIGEPVVSSTQNTQGCQTEMPDSSMETLERPHSLNIKKTCAMSPMYKSTVDVSCETDDFILSRQPSKDSVSVSTETEIDSNSHKTYVHCSTDTHAHEQDNNKAIECSSGLDVFSTEGHTRSELSVDCSVVDMSGCTNKRKSIESDSVDSKFIKMTDSKVPKRSLSYCGNSSSKAAYLAQPLSPTKLTLKFTATKSSSKMSSKSSAANTQSLNRPLTSQVPKSAASSNISGFQSPCQSVLNSPTLKSPSPTLPTQKSPTTAEPSGFQSQYQSFVMEFPEKLNRLEDMPKEIVKPITIPKSVLPDKMTVTKVLSRKTVKPGRPRGRPPKYRPIDATSCSLKEKKSKSRSRSPKYVKGIEETSDIGKEIMLDIDRVRHKSDTAAINNSPKISTAYSWIKKIDSNSKMSERKPEKLKLKDTHENPPSDRIIPKQFVYFSNGQYTIASVSSLTTLKQSSPVSPPPKTVFTSEVYSSNKNVKNTNNDDQSVTKTCSSKVKHMNYDGLALKEQAANEITKDLNNSSVQNTQDEKSESNVSSKVDSNQNRIVRQTVSKTNTSSTNVAAASDKQTIEPSQYPRYCHQIPFFAQLSGTGLRTSHKPTTHLNIPNLNSHFSGTHHLYSKERFESERLGTPACRPFSLNDSSPSSSVASKFEDPGRIEATTLPCTTYLQTYPMPYLGLVHSHLLSSLPPPPPLTPIGLYSNCTKSTSDSSLNAHNVVSSAKAVSYKYNTALPKGKEKSLDRVISAITEMRTKKETREQLNGIDLSTKGSRQNEENRDSPNNLKLGDKFEFTDDEDNVSLPPRLHAKTHKDSVENKSSA